MCRTHIRFTFYDTSAVHSQSYPEARHAHEAAGCPSDIQRRYRLLLLCTPADSGHNSHSHVPCGYRLHQRLPAAPEQCPVAMLRQAVHGSAPRYQTCSSDIQLIHQCDKSAYPLCCMPEDKDADRFYPDRKDQPHCPQHDTVQRYRAAMAVHVHRFCGCIVCVLPCSVHSCASAHAL